MATKKNTAATETAVERFMVSTDALAIALKYEGDVVKLETSKAALVKLFRDHNIAEKHFGAAKAGDNEHVSARHFLYSLAAHAVKIDGKMLNAAGIAAFFDDTVPSNRIINGAPKGGKVEGGRSWNNRISNKVGTQWRKLFIDAAKADEAAALAAQAAADLAAGIKPAEASDAEKKKAAEEKCANFWSGLLQRAYNKTFAEDGAHIIGDMTALQDAIKACAKETGAKLKPKK